MAEGIMEIDDGNFEAAITARIYILDKGSFSSGGNGPGLLGRIVGRRLPRGPFFILFSKMDTKKAPSETTWEDVRSMVTEGRLRVSGCLCRGL